jgi:hypothetical protein
MWIEEVFRNDALHKGLTDGFFHSDDWGAEFSETFFIA